MKIPARASFSYLLSGVLGKGLSFISTLFFTRLLTPADYGEYAVYMSWLGIGETCISAFISGSLIYKGFSDFKERSREFLSTLLITFLAFGTLFCLPLFAFSAFFDFPIRLFPFLFLQVLFDGILLVKLYEKKHLYEYRAVVITSIGEAVISIISSLLLIKYAGLGFIGRIIGYLIPTAVFGSFYFFTADFSKINKKIFGYIVKQAIPLLPSTIALAISMQTDKLIIDSLMGSIATARYSVVHSVGICGVFLVTALGSALHPWINRKLEVSNYDSIIDIAAPLLSLFSSFSVFLVAVAPIAIRILAPNEYAEALPSIAPLAISIIPYFASNLNTVYLIHLDRGKDVSKITVISSISGIIANVILIPLFGYLGAGLSALLSSFSSYILGVFFLQRTKKVQIIPKRNVFSSLLLSSALSLFISLSDQLPFLIPILLIPPAILLVGSSLKAKEMIFE